MSNARTITALMNNYKDFDIGGQRAKLDEAKSDMKVVRPVERYSYALTRAALNVFVHHNFAELLNCLAFDIDSFEDAVRDYVPQVWPAYIREAENTLATARIKQLTPLEFKDWEAEGGNRIGAWHRLTFPEVEVDVLWEVSNPPRRLGKFVGLCYLDTDRNQVFDEPVEHVKPYRRLGSLHLQMITDEMLDALGVSPETAISAIKWQMR